MLQNSAIRNYSKTANSPFDIVCIQQNAVPGQLLCHESIAVVSVVAAKFDDRRVHMDITRQAQVHDGLSAIRLDLKATKITFVTHGPALTPTVVAVATLVTEDKALAGGYNL